MAQSSPLGVPGVALVTGGGSGIGRATCVLLAREGVRGLAVADVDGREAKIVKEEVEKAATNAEFRCIFEVVDVRDEQSVTDMISSIVDKFGRLDYAVNCAGIGLKKALNDTEAQEWDRVIGINLSAVFTCCRAEVKQMLKQQPLESKSAYHPLQVGAIVNVSSLAGVTGLRHSGAYTASKHGVIGLTRTYALDYPEVEINAILPGNVTTPLNDATGDMKTDALDKVNNWTLMRRFGLPAEIAEGIVWLLGSRSNFAHGSCLTMDGGYTAH